VSRLFSHLLSSEPGTAHLFARGIPSGLEGVTYREVARRAIRRGVSYLVCGFTRQSGDGGGGERGRVVVFNPRVDTDPGKDSCLVEGDELILLASGEPDLLGLVG